MHDQNAINGSQEKKITIIASCIGWGSGVASAEQGPLDLLNAGLADRLQAEVTVLKAIPSMNDGALPPAEIESCIVKHTSLVSDAVCAAISDGKFPVVIGGDHTTAIGLYSGMARACGQVGVVWMDTHPDLNTPETTPSGNVHGMVLAGVLGRGSEAMVHATQDCKTIDTHVAMVGVRSIDSGEQRWLDEGNINCMKMSQVRDRGLDVCLADAVDTANQAESGYGLTIDLDVIDPTQAPYVATAVDGGINAEELAFVLKSIPRPERLLGMEVTEFTPRNEQDAQPACNLVATLVNAVWKHAVNKQDSGSKA
jgi:arginase